MLLLAGCLSRSSAGQYDKSYTIAGRATVSVRTNDGSVRVITSDAKEVQFHVKYTGAITSGGGGGPRIDSRQNGDSVELDAEVNSSLFFGGARHMQIEVDMPKDADLHIEGGDGSVVTDAVNGHVVIHTQDGSIRATQLTGTIELGSKDGSIGVDTAKGDLKVHNNDGSIRAERVDGHCEIANSDGSIHVDGRFDSFDVSSNDGSVAAHVEPGSQHTSTWQLRTKDGSVHLSLPPDLKANLDVSSNNGTVTVDLPAVVQKSASRSRVEGEMNGGGPDFLVHTSDGSIHVGPT
jgi:hypothetical protein